VTPPSAARVDVGVVTWNTAELTCTALRRLLDTDQGVELRVLVHDNASSDGTVQALRERVPEAEVEAGDANLGFARGMNALLARSDAPWFLPLNSDAWPEPHAIARMLATAERHPRCAAVAPRIERPDGELEHSTNPFPSLSVAALTATAVYHRIAKRTAWRKQLFGVWQHDVEREVDWAVGAALLMRRDAVDEIGGFDERFFMYAEDVEWCWRARRRGWEIWFTPDALIRHIGNASGAQNYGRRRTEAWIANTYRFYRSEHGAASTAAYHVLNAAGAARAVTGSLLKRDRDRARYWQHHLRAHLRRYPPADTGPPQQS
jgi:N-acetylglucosaminyl-diphospho-decaprenol L-rhamnosyltransferase